MKFNHFISNISVKLKSLFNSERFIYPLYIILPSAVDVLLKSLTLPFTLLLLELTHRPVFAMPDLVIAIPKNREFSAKIYLLRCSVFLSKSL